MKDPPCPDLSDEERFYIYGFVHPEDALTHPEMNVISLSHPSYYLAAMDAAESSLHQRIIHGAINLFTPEQWDGLLAWSGITFVPPEKPEVYLDEATGGLTKEAYDCEWAWKGFYDALYMRLPREALADTLWHHFLYGEPLGAWWVWYGDYAECPVCAIKSPSARERGLTPVREAECPVNCAGCGAEPKSLLHL